jgi:hypothetical protein
MGVESYLHKYSKVVVCAWLRKKIKIGEKFKGLSNIPLRLASPKQSPMYNVYQEYPVCKSLIEDEKSKIVGIDVLWEDWVRDNDLKKYVKSRFSIPTVYELKELKDKIELITVFDIGVIDNGTLKYIFELEHTHPCTAKKIKFINDHKLIGYELSAQKVMEQVKLPYAIDIRNSWNTTDNTDD